MRLEVMLHINIFALQQSHVRFGSPEDHFLEEEKAIELCAVNHQPLCRFEGRKR
jgi:hypothetical protein